MTGQQVEDALNAFVEAYTGTALSMTGFADCVLGLGERCGQPMVLVYDRDRIHAKLMVDGMSEEDAHEYIDFNITGAWVGDSTPIVMTVFNPAEWINDANPDV